MKVDLVARLDPYSMRVKPRDEHGRYCTQAVARRELRKRLRAAAKEYDAPQIAARREES